MPKPLPVTPAELEALAQEYGTPLQLYSEQGIRSQAQLLTSAFQRAGFADFKEYFAVKALPNPAVLLALMQEGCGLDCSSTGELWIAQQLGCEDIMYTSNYTSQKDLLQARNQRGVIINLDDASLVKSLKQVCDANGVDFPELICFRVNPGMGNTSSETDSNLLGGPSAKFGLPLESLEQAYTEAKLYGAKRFGIHMMTGSCVLDVPYWSGTVGTLLRAMLELQTKVGIPAFEFVNIGGGIGIPYRPDQQEVDVNQVAQAVAGQFTQLLGEDKSKWPRLYMENGRFLTGPFGWLVTRCHATKECFGKQFFGVDACMANLMRPGMYGSYHHIEVPSRQEKTLAPASVVGTLCENNDWFAKDRDLPATAQVGDLFVIFDSGAHSHSMGFQYNAKLRAPEVLIGTDNVPRLIREREVIEDLFANTLLPDNIRGALPARVVKNKTAACHKKLVVCGASGGVALALVGLAAFALHRAVCVAKD